MSQNVPPGKKVRDVALGIAEIGEEALERSVTTGASVPGEKMDKGAIAEARFLHCGCLTRGIHFSEASRPAAPPIPLAS